MKKARASAKFNNFASARCARASAKFIYFCFPVYFSGRARWFAAGRRVYTFGGQLTIARPLFVTKGRHERTPRARDMCGCAQSGCIHAVMRPTRFGTPARQTGRGKQPHRRKRPATTRPGCHIKLHFPLGGTATGRLFAGLRSAGFKVQGSCSGKPLGQGGHEPDCAPLRCGRSAEDGAVLAGSILFPPAT